MANRCVRRDQISPSGQGASAMTMRDPKRLKEQATLEGANASRNAVAHCLIYAYDCVVDAKGDRSMVPYKAMV